MRMLATPQIPIDMLVLSPSYTVSQSELNQDTKSPVLFSSKKLISLLEIDLKRSDQSLLPIF